MPAARTPARRTKPAALRAATYCRISHDPYGLEAGVERQRKDTAAIARQHGYTVAAEHRFEDNDRSASRYATREREGWAQLMAAVEAGEVDALVAYNLDRLLRQPKELERLIDAADRGLEVATATGKLDLATTDGRMQARFSCMMAATEADKVSDRQRAKLRHDAANGVPHWARRPYGYASNVGLVGDDGKRLRERAVEPAGFAPGDVVPEEAAWVLKMASWVVDDGLSASAVARRLNDAGVTTTRGEGWQAITVKKVLTAPRTAGLRDHHGEVLPEAQASWAPILERSRWEQVCAVLASRSTGPRGGGRRSMLSKLVRCGRCGTRKPMTRMGGDGRKEWRCVPRPDGGCGMSVKASHFEAVVVADLLDAIVAAKPTARRADQAPADDVDTLRAQLTALGARWGAGELRDFEYEAARGPLMARLNAAERKLEAAQFAAAPSALLAGKGGPRETWEALNDDRRRRIILAMVDHITVMPAAKRGVWNPDRVVITWKA